MKDWLKIAIQNSSNTDRLKNQTSLKPIDRFDRLENFASDAGSILSEEDKIRFEDQGWLEITAPLVGTNIYILENPDQFRGRNKVVLPDSTLPRYTLDEIKALAGLSPEEVKFLHQEKVGFGGVISIPKESFQKKLEKRQARMETTNYPRNEEWKKRFFNR